MIMMLKSIWNGDAALLGMVVRNFWVWIQGHSLIIEEASCKLGALAASNEPKRLGGPLVRAWFPLQAVKNRKCPTIMR